MANQLKLWCILLSEKDLNPAFSIKIDINEDIDILKDMIKLKNAPELDYIAAPRLKLWKCSFPFNDSIKATLDSLRFDGTDYCLDHLSPTSTVGESFPEPPPIKTLHLVVKLPPVPTISPSNSHDRVLSQVDEEMSSFVFKIWNKRNAHANLFELTNIVRLDPPSNVQTPDKCYVMKSPPFGRCSQKLNGILIRNEFIQAVKDINEFYKGRDFANVDNILNDMMDTTPDDNARMVDMFPTIISNPFLVEGFPKELTNSGVIITGTPGIGKSVLLEFILHLRSLAGLTTILIKRKDMADLFSSASVTRLHESKIVKSKLPKHTWVLIDSNRDVTDVPEWVTDLDLFIVQAASTRPLRMEWEKKELDVSRYYMKPWSVEEVLAARMLQKRCSRSEAELEIFCEHYTGSAHAAFSSLSLLQHESSLNGKIAALSVEQIIRMLDKLPSTEMSVDDGLPHHIFVIRPGNTRSEGLIEVATPYLTNKMVDNLTPKLHVAAQELYKLFRRNDWTNGAAGQLLNGVVRGIFTRGGSWKIRQMNKSPRQGLQCEHWKILSSEIYKDEYLTIGLPNHPLLSISNAPPAEGTIFDKIETRFFPPTAQVKLATAYYVPLSPNEATFDSFYYNADRRQATVLQVTTSTSHPMKVKGLKRLKDLGVSSIHYVAVTGLQDEFDLPVPNEYSKFVKEKYHLVLEKLN